TSWRNGVVRPASIESDLPVGLGRPNRGGVHSRAVLSRRTGRACHQNRGQQTQARRSSRVFLVEHSEECRTSGVGQRCFECYNIGPKGVACCVWCSWSKTLLPNAV